MRRTLVLGLDGATFRVLTPLIEAGHLPNLKTLRESGTSGPLESTMPPVTGPAWLSLATGMSPGKTGVYDFIRRDPDSDGYDFHYLDSGAYQGRAVWDYLGASGVDVGVVDYPTLSPAYEVNGFMVCGGLGSDELETWPDLSKALADLDSVESHIDIGNEAYRNLELFASDIRDNLEARAARLKRVLRTQDWRFCWAVLQEPDWVQHVMWKCFDSSYAEHTSVSTHERELFVAFWEHIDDIVGQCRDIVGEDGNIIVQSDHGFGPMYDRSFRLNTWLKQEGYLVPRSGGSSQFWLKKSLWNKMSTFASAINLQEYAPSLFRWGKNSFSTMAIELGSIDLDQSTAFDPGHIQSMGGIYINDALVIDSEQREALIKELRQKLVAVGDGHDLPIETYTPEELYGKTTEASPDLIVRAAGYNIENGDWDRPVVGDRPDRLSHQTGSHRRDGIFIADGPDFVSTTISEATIWDITPTLLHLFDHPIPATMDGDVLADVLTTDRTVERVDVEDAGAMDHRLNETETVAMHDQLSDLGYFD